MLISFNAFKITPSGVRRLLPGALAVLACSLAAVSLGAGAAQAAPGHHTGFLHRHRTGASVGAAIAAHHYAKKGAHNRVASGRRPNLAERHPMLSGAAAGIATHHHLKKH